ncbi:hypothetical protein HHK36_009066 [Tetracentron sinense]|uniref:BED-type domain-containing protein n=1 Tax=Tetracentron sinense TaxID=13715 RepID=A0A834ZER9_TETSI|nr:hypothetical protein HHK36_009066 [Tetracentron sinense]
MEPLSEGLDVLSNPGVLLASTDALLIPMYPASNTTNVNMFKDEHKIIYGVCSIVTLKVMSQPTTTPTPITSSAPTPSHSDPVVNPTPSVTQVETENPQTLDELSKNPSTTEKRLTSTVWEDFKRTKNPDGSKIATCKHCQRIFNGDSSRGTSHLRNHAKRCNLKVYHAVNQQIISKTKNVNETTNRLSTFKFDQERSRLDLARWIVKHEEPFNVVEHEYFQIFLGNLQPLFKLVSRNTIKSDVMKVYEEEREKLYSILDLLPSRISLTTDMWTSGQNDGYCCLTSHFINDDWQLQKKILSFVTVETPHTTETLSRVIREQVLKWNIDSKLCSITVDNASTNDAMFVEYAYRQIYGVDADSYILRIRFTVGDLYAEYASVSTSYPIGDKQDSSSSSGATCGWGLVFLASSCFRYSIRRSVIGGVQMEGLLSHGFQIIEKLKLGPSHVFCSCLTFFDHHNFTRTLWDCQALSNASSYS